MNNRKISFALTFSRKDMTFSVDSLLHTSDDNQS